MLKVEVIYQDKYLFVINKPAGMISNRSLTTKGQITLQDWIEGQGYWQMADEDSVNTERQEFIKRSGLVHRLDKDTSGVMVVAKEPRSFKKLIEQFKKREVEKEYIALLHGIIKPKKGTIFLPLARDRLNRKKFSVSVEGRRAETSWSVEKTYSAVKKRGYSLSGYQGFCLVRLKPRTGRTHQIRVHLSHIKHPIVGDIRYTGRKRAREDRKWCPRQFLHAFKLEFRHPKNEKKVMFKAELAADLSRVLKLLS